MMDGVDKLRTLPRNGTNWFGAVVTASVGTIEAIADEIEAETAEMKAFCERIEKAAKAREELEVFGTAYMPLPLDADGVPIRPGEKLVHVPGGWEFSADTIEIDTWGAHVRANGQARVPSACCRHVKPRTLEDVLFEFGEEFEGEIDEITPIIAKYAEEIRELMGGAE